jgi:hypothetical protein
MGCKEITSVYVVSHYVVDFQIRPVEVHLWKTLSIESNCKMESSIGWVWHSIYDKENCERECYCRSPGRPCYGRLLVIKLWLSWWRCALVEEGKSDCWVMYFDGVVNVCGNGVSVVIISPDKKQYPISVKLQFRCTNNTTEYEACILVLEVVLELNIRKICMETQCWSSAK